MRALRLVTVLIFGAAALFSENGRDAWLRYAPLGDAAARPYRTAVPASIVTLGDAPTLQSARQEVERGVHGMLGVSLREETRVPAAGAIVVGTLEQVRQAFPQAGLSATIAD